MRLMLPTLTPTVRSILIVLFASFLVQTVVAVGDPMGLYRLLALQVGFGVHTAWQWISHPLVEHPGGVVSRLLDLAMIYLIASPFEERFGARNTVVLAFAGVIGAALAAMALAAAAPMFSSTLAGANGIVFAAVGAFAMMRRGQPTQFLFLPVTNAWGVVAVLLAFIAIQCAWAHTATPFVAAVGGTAAGALVVAWLERRRRKVVSAPGGGQTKRARPAHLQLIKGGQSARPPEDERPRWLN